MKMLGAKVIAATSGSQTLKDATNEAIRDWIQNPVDTHYIIGSVVGPHPYPDMVARFQSVISEEIKWQLKEQTGSENPVSYTHLRQVDIPDAKFILYRYILAIDHFKDEMYLLENHLDQHVKTIDKIESWIQNTAGIQSFKFVRHGSETSSLTDQDFRDLVTKGKYHYKIGDVFQDVYKRQR